MMAFMVLSRAPPPVALLGFLRVREKRTEMLLQSCSWFKFLYIVSFNDLILFYLFIYLFKRSKGMIVTLLHPRGRRPQLRSCMLRRLRILKVKSGIESLRLALLFVQLLFFFQSSAFFYICWSLATFCNCWFLAYYEWNFLFQVSICW